MQICDRANAGPCAQQRRDQQVVEMAVGELEIEALAARTPDQDFTAAHAVRADLVAHHRLIVVGQGNARDPHGLEDGIGRRGVARGFLHQCQACAITIHHGLPPVKTRGRIQTRRTAGYSTNGPWQNHAHAAHPVSVHHSSRHRIAAIERARLLHPRIVSLNPYP
jgi:hypothetical protein